MKCSDFFAFLKMTGSINGITFLFLICITTLLGQAQNYQQKWTEPDYNYNRPRDRSFGSSLSEPSGYNQNSHEYRRFASELQNNPPHGQYNHYNHGYYRHSHNINYDTPRWDYPLPNNQYPNSYNRNYPNYNANRGSWYNWATTKKYTPSSPPTTNEANSGQLSENNDFNITSEDESVRRNNIKRKSEDYNPSKMVYPNETPNVKYLNPKHHNENCTFGLCESAIEYPSDKIQRIISKSKELRQYFEGLNTNFQPSIINRFGEDEESLCATMRHTHFPQSAVNTDNVEKYLVNVGDYKQGIVLETCQNEGQNCKFSESFPTGYTTTCEQRYSVQRLMTARKESEEVVFDNFRLPTCCICKVTRDKT